jgi:hypothetical protein
MAAKAMDNIDTTPPAFGATPNFRHMIVMNYRRWFKKAVALPSGTLTLYADDGTTPLAVQAIPAVPATQTQGSA